MQPLVSVIILTYNHASYIAQAIDSVLMQKTNFDFEIIIGEDCSTDCTKEIIYEYLPKCNNRIKLIKSENNVGAIANEYRTLKECVGKYIALCEGDDFWTDPLKLQKQVEFLEHNPEYGMAHTDSNRFYQDTKRIEKDYNKNNSIPFPSGNIFNELLKKFYFITTATVLVRREIFLSAFNPELFEERKWELTDLPIWLEISAKTKIKYLDETTATYRLNDGSMSRTKDLRKHYEFHKSVYDIRYYYWEKYSKDLQIKRVLDTHYYDMMIGDAYKMKNLQIAKDALKSMKEKGLEPTLKQRIKYLLLLFYNFGRVKNK